MFPRAFLHTCFQHHEGEYTGKCNVGDIRWITSGTDSTIYCFVWKPVVGTLRYVETCRQVGGVNPGAFGEHSNRVSCSEALSARSTWSECVELLVFAIRFMFSWNDYRAYRLMEKDLSIAWVQIQYLNWQGHIHERLEQSRRFGSPCNHSFWQACVRYISRDAIIYAGARPDMCIRIQQACWYWSYLVCMFRNTSVYEICEWCLSTIHVYRRGYQKFALTLAS